MKTYLDCIPCFFNQAIRASRMVTQDERVIKKVLDTIGDIVKDIPMDSPPPATGRLVYRIIKETINNDDPYRKVKKESTRKALSLYPEIKRRVENGDDPLLLAIKAAIGGNIIDFGVNRTFDIDKELKNIFNIHFAIDDYLLFKDKLSEVEEVLYLGDNAGETVFDRILIEEMVKLNKKVTFVVRGNPIINDATYEDAVDAGIDRVADILSSGTDAPGILLDTCTPEFIERFNRSEFIISKGQGNYEALSDVERPIFFLLKVKCHIVARDLGVEEGDIVLKASDFLKRR